METTSYVTPDLPPYLKHEEKFGPMELRVEVSTGGERLHHLVLYEVVVYDARGGDDGYRHWVNLYRGYDVKAAGRMLAAARIELARQVGEIAFGFNPRQLTKHGMEAKLARFAAKDFMTENPNQQET